MNWWQRLQIWLGGKPEAPDSMPDLNSTSPPFAPELPSRFAVPSAESTYSDFPGDLPPTPEEVKRNQEAFDPMHWDKEAKK